MGLNRTYHSLFRLSRQFPTIKVGALGKSASHSFNQSSSQLFKESQFFFLSVFSTTEFVTAHVFQQLQSFCNWVLFKTSVFKNKVFPAM